MFSPKIFFLVLFLTASCASQPKKGAQENARPPEGYISESAAIGLMGRSFFVGCMTALHARGLKTVAEECRKLSKDHAQEIKEIVNQKQEP